MIPPQPPERIRQHGGLVGVGMRTDTADELLVVALEHQRFFHLKIRQPPVAGLVIEVVLPVLETDANLFLLRLADDARVCVAVTDIGEAADRRPHFAELIGLLPRDRPRANTPRGSPA